MKYREAFEPDKGYRLFRHRMSVLVQAISFGERLSELQLSQYDEAMNQFLGSIDGRAHTQSPLAAPLGPSDFGAAAEPFCKYVSDETLTHLQRGSFQFGTAQYYRESENQYIRDHMEGFSTFHVGLGNRQLHASVLSGFNCLIFCGTTADETHEPYMRAKFGPNKVVIEDTSAFSSRVAQQLGARGSYIYKVAYSDRKNYVLESDEIPDLVASLGNSGLTSRDLHEINRRFFGLFYKSSFFPSLFAKPTAFAPEREHRFVFELPEDASRSVVQILDPTLLALVKVRRCSDETH